MDLLKRLKTAFEKVDLQDQKQLFSTIQSLHLSIDEVSQFITPPQELEYGRNVIFRNEQAEVIIVYLPSFAKTLIHDHGTSIGGLFVVQGKLLNILYHPDEHGPLYAQTEAYSQNDIFLVKGETTHMMFNPTLSPVITFHVYTPPLKDGKSYSISK
ncbi:cysteine dioxygenase [Cytobacillus purgationiresistens]|uniref:Cysteine dioxygenase n=1 Tax=Cytobacillus purgationiresistens TaxID=863449 RepID=A0ABU0AK35_9BACI|nr:cysteine dioxygenase family protein [Cytobacillus purgationiresistens]MDQ0271629.1 cysteine dioxygenase [Cytobacillus purgationiresistens]